MLRRLGLVLWRRLILPRLLRAELGLRGLAAGRGRLGLRQRVDGKAGNRETTGDCRNGAEHRKAFHLGLLLLSPR
jgi:hypothetical protein